MFIYIEIKMKERIQKEFISYIYTKINWLLKNIKLKEYLNDYNNRQKRFKSII